MQSSRRSVVAAGASNQSGTGWGAGGVVSTPVGEKAFVVTRWDGNSGNVMVTGAIPLPPGTLTAATLQNFKVRDSTNTEKTIGVKALKGTFPGGSLRSVAVQFQHSVTNNTPVSFTVEFAATRGTTDFTYVEPIYTSATMTVAAMNHKAVIIPDDADYWISTFVALVPLRSEANTSVSRQKEWFSTDTVYDTYRSMKGWSDNLYASGGTITSLPASGYDQGHGFLCGAIRAADRTTRLYWYQRFYDFIVSAYVTATDHYYLPQSSAGAAYTFGAAYDASLPVVAGSNDGAGVPESKSPIALDLAVSYLSMGWSYPWRKTVVFMNRAWGDVSTQTGLRDRILNLFGDGTIRQNIAGNLSWLFTAYVIEANTQVSTGAGGGRNNNTYNWTDTITWILDGLEQYKRTAPALTAGLMGGRPTDTETVSPNFMFLHVGKWLAFCYNNIINDSRIPAQVQAIADYLLGQMYFTSDVADGTPIATSGAEVALVYLPTSSPYTQAEAEARAVGVSGESEDFAYGPYLTEIFGFVYANTGTAAYKTAGDRCASRRAIFVMPPATRGAGESPSQKNWGEYFCGTNQSYLHYAAGGSTRPISGAHPTALANQTTHAGP